MISQKKKKSTPKQVKRFGIVQYDAWLEPVEQNVIDRFNRYDWRLKEISEHFGSLEKFADAYNYYGVNYDKKQKGWIYREWAPGAFGLFLMGDFNNWNRESHPLVKKDFGVWEIFLPDEHYDNLIQHQSKFKVLVHSPNGWHDRIPAYIRRVIQDDNTKDFCAQFWKPEKKFSWTGDNFDVKSIKNLLIYETHVGMAQEKAGVGTYNEFTENILPRVKAAGYNTIQIMAIAEHPYYGSFGYHVSSFFAPSSRFGTPEDLKKLIKTAHKMGIAVIMDIVHSHTVKNLNEGINMWDGTDYQYSHPGERGNHPVWDSKLFDYGKTEVLRFLLSNVKYWIEEFRFDGFRFDGVTSMLYHDHGIGTNFGDRDLYFKDNVEYDAVTYLMLANKLIHDLKPGAISIAEDVSGMPGLVNKPEDGGIGFDYRMGMGLPDYWIKLLKEKSDDEWHMGEMYDVMLKRLPTVRTVAYAESHDQALVGDKTIAFRLMDKEMYFAMHVNDENMVVDRGIALHKMIRLFTISLGGEAYLNFMGNEFGHPEWIDFPREGNNWSYNHARRQWSLVDNPDLRFRFLARFDREMISIIDKYNITNSWFPQLLQIDEENKTIVFERNHLIFVFNFHPVRSIPNYEIKVPAKGKYKIILNSDSAEFGGFNRIDDKMIYETFDPKHYIHLKIYNINRTVTVFQRCE